MFHNIHREYLEKRETEVITIFDFLFNQENFSADEIADMNMKDIQMLLQELLAQNAANSDNMPPCLNGTP